MLFLRIVCECCSAKSKRNGKAQYARTSASPVKKGASILAAAGSLHRV
jgi:hypothetical protein